jgi:hypothetical protein
MLMSTFWTSLSWLAGAVLLVILAYAVTRAASFAHFRTKLEYLRSVLREINRGGGPHGR